MIQQIDRQTGMCMSLSARPGNFGCRFFNFIFGELDMNFIYRAIAPSDLADALRGMRALNIRGSALSMPFKEQAIPLLDAVDPVAAKIGAVNTVVNDAGKLTGYNTDFLGVRECLRAASVESTAKVALLGSGGMAKAIAFALNDLGFKQTTVVARNAKTRAEIAESYGFTGSPELNGTQYDVLINATPVGMNPDPAGTMSFPESSIGSASLVIDSVADPVETGLIVSARKQNKSVITGFDIVVKQAVQQFRLYFDRELPEELVQRAAKHVKQ